jgi:hypothetical protein
MIKRPAWTVFKNVEKSWRNRTASNCKGHKKGHSALADSSDSNLIGFRQLEAIAGQLHIKDGGARMISDELAR